MNATNHVRTAKAWRDRLTGRVPFDASGAEAAIRRAYQASALPEPSQILWATGPREAAQAIAFVQSPPRRVRLMALAVLGLGAAAWVGLALTIGGSSPAAQPPVEAATSSAVLAGLSLALTIGRLPLPPGLSVRQYDGKMILIGAIFFIALTGYMFALERFGGLPINPVGRGAALALAAAVGTLPGAFLLWRMRRTYPHLPRSLRELAPSRSVAQQLQRERGRQWLSPQPTIIGPRPEDSLLQAYRSAYREAFGQQQANVLDSSSLTRISRAASWNDSRRIAADVFVNLGPEAVAGTQPHLDGMEDAARAAAVTRIGTSGTAAAFADLAFHVDRLYPFATVAVAVRPATTVALDAEGRPHAEDGPALAWADGTRIHAWHGRLAPPELLDQNQPITRSRIDREGDPERRWVLIERYGLGRYLLESGATEIQHDECGRLYRLAQLWSEPILAVRVVNHTPEPDGSVREFWLRVPPTVATARQAVAWTFDLPAEDYNPIAQS